MQKQSILGHILWKVGEKVLRRKIIRTSGVISKCIEWATLFKIIATSSTFVQNFVYCLLPSPTVPCYIFRLTHEEFSTFKWVVNAKLAKNLKYNIESIEK